MSPEAELNLDRLADLLAERLASRLHAPPPARFLSVADAAAYAAISPDSVRSMLTSGRLTALRPVAGRVVVDRQELDAAIRASAGRPRTRRGKRSV
jgi:excisionase family DNA binding protein